MSATPASLSFPAEGPPRAGDAPLPPPIVPGSTAHRAARWALFVGGFATFGMFYGPQPLLPLFGSAFGLDAAQASGVLSATAGAMALGLIPAGFLAQRYGPKPVMVAAIVLGALCSLACAVAPSYGALVALRALLGLGLAGLPAVSTAWLAEEVDPRALGQSVGLIIAGNAAGGMSSRLVCGLLADHTGWRGAFAGLGVLGVLAAFEFWRSLPPSRRHRPRPLHPRHALGDLRAVANERGLVPLFGLALLLMGSFVSLYNYLGFRLVAPPFALSHATLGAVFLLYVVGMFSSPWAGRQAERRGSPRVLAAMLALCAVGLVLTLSNALPLIIAGVALFTFGFFAAHSVASAWVGRIARHSRSLAAAAYLTTYYLGASSMGWLGGHAWQAGAWPGVLGFLGLLWLGCVAHAWRMGRIAAASRADVVSRSAG
jgi:YNFM family putative membrane transporter